MLWFIGLGISGISELSDSTKEVIKNAKIVYLESKAARF
jgi:Diphthamide biosynthesis methyltransferase